MDIQNIQKDGQSGPVCTNDPEVVLPILLAEITVADSISTGYEPPSSKKDDLIYFAGVTLFGNLFKPALVYMARSAKQNGIDAAQKGDAAEAIGHYENAYNKFKAAGDMAGAADALELLAESYLNDGNVPKAYSLYNQLVTDIEGGRLAVTPENLVQIKLGRARAAEIHLENVMNSNLRSANDAIRLGQFESARTSLEKALNAREVAMAYGIRTGRFVGVNMAAELGDSAGLLGNLSETETTNGVPLKHGLSAMIYDVLNLEHRKVEYAAYAEDLLKAAKRFNNNLPEVSKELIGRASWALTKLGYGPERDVIEDKIIIAGQRNKGQLRHMQAALIQLELRRVEGGSMRFSEPENRANALLKNGQLADALEQLKVAAAEYEKEGKMTDAAAMNMAQGTIFMSMKTDAGYQEAWRVYKEATYTYRMLGDQENAERADKRLTKAKFKCLCIEMEKELDKILAAAENDVNSEDFHQRIRASYRSIRDLRGKYGDSVYRFLAADGALNADKIAKLRAMAKKNYEDALFWAEGSPVDMGVGADMDKAEACMDIAIKLDIISQRPVGEFQDGIRTHMGNILRQMLARWDNNEAFNKRSIRLMRLKRILHDSGLPLGEGPEILQLFEEARKYRASGNLPTPIEANLETLLILESEAEKLTAKRDALIEFMGSGEMTNKRAEADLSLYIAKLDGQIARIQKASGAPLQKVNDTIAHQVHYMENAGAIEVELDPIRGGKIMASAGMIADWEAPSGEAAKELAEGEAKPDQNPFSEERDKPSWPDKVRAAEIMKAREGVEKAREAVKKIEKPK